MNILFIGDIFGKPGREIARRAIPALVEQRNIDFVIANVENSAAGFGVTGDIADTILSYGVDVMTTGNHVWDKKEVLEYIPREPRLLRPANFPAGVPGRGSILGRTRTGEPWPRFGGRLTRRHAGRTFRVIPRIRTRTRWRRRGAVRRR